MFVNRINIYFFFLKFYTSQRNIEQKTNNNYMINNTNTRNITNKSIENNEIKYVPSSPINTSDINFDLFSI